MIRPITKDDYTLLYALFQAYALQVTIDELETRNDFTQEFKKETNRFTNHLRKRVLKVLNQLYDLDSDEFQVMDEAISYNAKEFGLKGFTEFFEIVD